MIAAVVFAAEDIDGQAGVGRAGLALDGYGHRAGDDDLHIQAAGHRAGVSNINAESRVHGDPPLRDILLKEVRIRNLSKRVRFKAIQE